MKKRMAILGTIIIFIVSICLLLLPKTKSEDSSQISNYPDSYMVKTNNYFDYQPGLECAAFSSAYLLRYYGQEAEGLKLFETFPGKLSGGGVRPDGVTEFFKSQGYDWWS